MSRSRNRKDSNVVDETEDEFDYKSAFKSVMKQNETVMQQNAALLKLLESQNGGSSRVMHDIAGRVPLFRFDDQVEDCFSMWYDRHVNAFTVDGESLSDEQRGRLLLERLDESSFSKFKRHHLPNDVYKLSFDVAVQSLKSLFDKSTSMFTHRFQLLHITKEMDQDLLT